MTEKDLNEFEKEFGFKLLPTRECDLLPSENEIYGAMALLRKLVNKADSFEWIPFTFDEEGVLNCELPDVDEEILVSDGDSVWQDTWCEADEGYELESGIEIEDLAWRQLPKPYEENQNETNC